MPIQAPQWTDFLTCPVCYNEFDAQCRRPISLGCGHTICHSCLSKLSKQQCPFDQTEVHINIEKLPLNYGLMQLIGGHRPPATVELNVDDIKDNQQQFDASRTCIEELALYLKSLSSVMSGNGTNGMVNGASCLTNGNGNLGGPISKPMLRKLVTLVNCQLAEEEGRCRALRAARSLGERTVKELILLHQNPQQLSTNLWACVRSRGCQFLGPAMQEEVLKLILLALEDGNSLSRKVLVLFVVNRLESQFTQASKTSIGHVVQLLYRASCFKVTKRDGDSSLLQLHEKYRTYSALRKEHDTQIVQIAMEAGLHISPEQWSALLYGDDEHKSHMQSIIDKLQTPASFSSSIQELVIALQRSGDPADLQRLRGELDRLADIDPNPEGPPPSWNELQEVMEALRTVVHGLVDYIQNHNTRTKGTTDSQQQSNNKYKTSMCRDIVQRGQCPRGINCSFAHSDEELERFVLEMTFHTHFHLNEHSRYRRRRVPANKAFANGVQRNGNSSSPETINGSSGLENGYCNGDSLERSPNDSPVNDSSGASASQNLSVAISPDGGASAIPAYRRLSQDQSQLLLQQAQNRFNGMHISNSPHTAYANGVAQSYGAAGRSYQSVNPDRNGNFTNGCYPAQTHHAVNGVNGISAVNGVAYPRPDASMSTEPRPAYKYVIPTTTPAFQPQIQASHGRPEVVLNGNGDHYYDMQRPNYPRIASPQVFHIQQQPHYQQAYFTQNDGSFPARPEFQNYYVPVQQPVATGFTFGYFGPGARGPRERERNGSDGGSSSDGSNGPREPVSRGRLPPSLRDELHSDLKLDTSSLSESSFETSKEDNLKLCGGDSLFDKSYGKSDRFGKSRVSSIGSGGIDGSSADYSSETLSSPFSNGSSHQGSPLSSQYSQEYVKCWEKFDKCDDLPPPPKMDSIGKPDTSSIWSPTDKKFGSETSSPDRSQIEMFASKFTIKDKWEDKWENSSYHSMYSSANLPKQYHSMAYLARNGYIGDDRYSKPMDRQASLDGPLSEDIYTGWPLDRKSIQPPPGLTSHLKMT